MKRTDTKTLAVAMDILSRDIESEDGVANDAIREAAERLREQAEAIKRLVESLEFACDCIESWGEYASEYMQYKHDLTGQVKSLRDVAEKAREEQ